MSSNGSYQRLVAKQVFSGDFNQDTYLFKESDDELAPLYPLLPTGQKAHRVFVVGTSEETEEVDPEYSYWRAESSTRLEHSMHMPANTSLPHRIISDPLKCQFTSP